MTESVALVAANGTCPQCGVEFRCGMEGGDAECWCAALPPLLPLPPKSVSAEPAASCLCPACLKERLATARDMRNPA